jgi:precorrin-6B methylase 2
MPSAQGFFKKPYLPFFLALFISHGCSRKITPYDSGPAASQKEIKETFQPILDFMNYKPGMSFADVGAGSGSVTVSMSTLMDNSIVYIQDIDSLILNQKNLSKLIAHYSKQHGRNLRDKIKFQKVIGTSCQTNLPNSTFDLIYSNGTVHSFSSLDSMATDLRKKLKPSGLLFFRDSFKTAKENYCIKCKKQLISTDEFLTIMKKYGFKLEKQLPDMKGYPIFGFSMAN